jgi:four helix bundle protein
MSGQSKIGSYRDLLVWRKGIDLVRSIYQITQTFPQDERFGLTSQIRRAAVSVPSNIAEGQARHTTREFIHFVSTAEGSIAEVDTQLVIAIELGICKAATPRRKRKMMLPSRHTCPLSLIPVTYHLSLVTRH